LSFIWNDQYNKIRHVVTNDKVEYYDLNDGQLLAKKMSTETETKSVFKDLYEVELEGSTLIIKEVTNESWPEETKQKGIFYLEQKNRDKKGISLKKKDFEKLLAIFKEISEK
jgi:hypothetical protein